MVSGGRGRGGAGVAGEQEAARFGGRRVEDGSRRRGVGDWGTRKPYRGPDNATGWAGGRQGEWLRHGGRDRPGGPAHNTPDGPHPTGRAHGRRPRGPAAGPMGRPRSTAARYERPGEAMRGARASPSAAAGATGGGGRGRRGHDGARWGPGGGGTELPNAEMKGRKGGCREMTAESSGGIVGDERAGAEEGGAGAEAFQEERARPRSARPATPQPAARRLRGE
nr:translation initiation factor IF-2-like [Aegilops tauschii subsp. strangulata]